MIKITSFTFNPFQENTYLLHDESKSAVLIDPGCSNAAENKALVEFIEDNELKLDKLLLTHAHIDHVFGNKFIKEKFGLDPLMTEKEIPIYEAADRSAQLYGLSYDAADVSLAKTTLEEGGTIKFGNSALEILWVPGHSPGHIVFINRDQNFMIGGDVLFKGSIGRTDLPGGDHQTLLRMIREKVFVLDEAMKVYPGHGDPTTVGFEKRNNPFF